MAFKSLLISSPQLRPRSRRAPPLPWADWHILTSVAQRSYLQLNCLVCSRYCFLPQALLSNQQPSSWLGFSGASPRLHLSSLPPESSLHWWRSLPSLPFLPENPVPLSCLSLRTSLVHPRPMTTQ